MKSWAKARIRACLSKRLAAHRILSGPNRGFHIVTSWHDYPSAIIGYGEVALLGWFNQNVQAGETWLDIGAHYGLTAIRLCDQVGSSGRVFAFEPSLSAAGCLAQTRRLNKFEQLTILPFGLAAKPGLSLVQLPESRGMVDSTLKPEEADFFESILVTSFANLWPQLNGGDDRVHGIKIDVQGMEIQVLHGLAPILDKQKPKLIVELHEGVSRSVLLELLRGLGYSNNPMPIEPMPGETEAQLLDNRIYLFPASAQ